LKNATMEQVQLLGPKITATFVHTHGHVGVKVETKPKAEVKSNPPVNSPPSNNVKPMITSEAPSNPVNKKTG
jgi:hypothetical protein